MELWITNKGYGGRFRAGECKEYFTALKEYMERTQ